MVGKQCWNNFMEYLFPKFWNWWRQRKHKQVSKEMNRWTLNLTVVCFQDTKDESHLHMAWEQDYHMQDPGRLALFDEYLEMSEYQREKEASIETNCNHLPSPTIWLRHTLCGRLSAGSALRAAKQRGRDSLGCLQNGHTGS